MNIRLKVLLIFLAVLFGIIAFATIFQNLNSSSGKKASLPKPTPSLGPIELTGWFAYWEEKESAMELPHLINELKTFSPLFYRVAPDGSLSRYEISNRNRVLKYARDANIPIAPVIGDEGDPKRLRALLTQDLVREKFITQLISEAKKENFTGWGIDFETLTSKDKDAFTDFIEDTATSLHDNDLRLDVIVFGRIEKDDYDPALAHDYQALGKSADEVQLMVYGYSNEQTSPGGQSPGKWFQSVLDYAVKSIPREKILVGLSTHGYDFSSNGEPEGVTFQQAEEKIEQNSARVIYNSKELSQVATYKTGTIEHEIWYEDSETIMEKVNIAREKYGINRFALWRIGAEDPKIWEELQRLSKK
jgi:spore germination protein YaaH